ncbi:MAG: hypothetical protein Q9216_001751 [Gyalolechia sp. 2 TL-2023]
MESSLHGEAKGKDNVFNKASQDPNPAERRTSARHDLQPAAPIEMTEIDEHPSTALPQKSEWPLNPISTEAIQETQASQPLKDENSLTRTPSIITPVSAPPREPLTVTSANTGPCPSGPAPYPLTRERTGPAIGPPLEKPMTNSQDGDFGGLSLPITLLLISGARHPFKIDERYLKKRNVNVDGNNPVNMSVYTLKELIWREWRDDCRFDAGITPHVVHMTVKPQEIVDEEDAKMAKTGSRDRDGSEVSAGCRCAIL